MAPIKMASAAAWDWKGILAAMVYLATFLAAGIAAYSAASAGSFVDEFVSAYPLALLACGIFFIVCIAWEAVRAVMKRSREASRRLSAPSSASSF